MCELTDSRLLDVSVVPGGRSLDLTLVLEYIDQDLSTYLSKAPASGLSRDSVKVWTQQGESTVAQRAQNTAASFR